MYRLVGSFQCIDGYISLHVENLGDRHSIRGATRLPLHNPIQLTLWTSGFITFGLYQVPKLYKVSLSGGASPASLACPANPTARLREALDQQLNLQAVRTAHQTQ